MSNLDRKHRGEALERSLLYTNAPLPRYRTYRDYSARRP